MLCQTLGMTTAANGEAWRPADNLANRFVLVRTQLGMDRKKFAALTGLTENQLQSIESGRSPRDLPAKVNRVHLATGVDREWLMWGGGELSPNDPDGCPLSGSNRGPADYKSVRPALDSVATDLAVAA